MDRALGRRGPLMVVLLAMLAAEHMAGAPLALRVYVGVCVAVLVVLNWAEIGREMMRELEGMWNER